MSATRPLSKPSLSVSYLGRVGTRAVGVVEVQCGVVMALRGRRRRLHFFRYLVCASQTTVVFLSLRAKPSPAIVPVWRHLCSVATAGLSCLPETAGILIAPESAAETVHHSPPNSSLSSLASSHQNQPSRQHPQPPTTPSNDNLPLLRLSLPLGPVPRLRRSHAPPCTPRRSARRSPPARPASSRKERSWARSGRRFPRSG